MVDNAFNRLAPSSIAGVIFTLEPMPPSASFNAATNVSCCAGSTCTTCACCCRYASTSSGNDFHATIFFICLFSLQRCSELGGFGQRLCLGLRFDDQRQDHRSDQ